MQRNQGGGSRRSAMKKIPKGSRRKRHDCVKGGRGEQKHFPIGKQPVDPYRRKDPGRCWTKEDQRGKNRRKRKKRRDPYNLWERKEISRSKNKTCKEKTRPTAQRGKAPVEDTSTGVQYRAGRGLKETDEEKGSPNRLPEKIPQPHPMDFETPKKSHPPTPTPSFCRRLQVKEQGLAAAGRRETPPLAKSPMINGETAPRKYRTGGNLLKAKGGTSAIE